MSNDSLLSRDSSGIRVNAFSPNPNKSLEVPIDSLGGYTFSFEYPKDLAILVFTDVPLTIVYNDNGISLPIDANSYYGIILNQHITSIVVSNAAELAGTLKIMVQ